MGEEREDEIRNREGERKVRTDFASGRGRGLGERGIVGGINSTTRI